MKHRNRKSFLPRGIFGRAALILIFPVVTLQLGVSVVFIQRHFDRVTRQMVSNVEPQIRLILSEINASKDIETALESVRPISIPLKLQVEINPKPSLETADQRRFVDLTGQIVMDELRKHVGNITAIDLVSDDAAYVGIHAATTLGEAVITLNRRAVSPLNSHQLLVLMVMFGFLMTLIAFVFLRNQLRPVWRLAEASEAFGKGQILEFAVSGATEVRSAANAFIDMRDRLSRHIEQRTAMLSNISHDLKTPLTRLRLGLAMVEQTPEIEGLISDVNDMSSMINEILEFTSGAKSEEFVLTSLASFLDEIVEKARKSGQNLVLSPSGDQIGGPPVHIPRSAVRRSLENLLGNAARHAENARLHAELSGGTLKLIVEDDGPGIPEDQREAAMRPFTRLDRARNLDDHSGVGLGLAIARDLAGIHGGSLDLGSSEDLGGLRVEFSLPV